VDLAQVTADDEAGVAEKMNGWRNRIIGSGEMRAGEFLANPRNWRIHPKPQQEAMTGVLNEVGWIQEVIVNQQTGNLIDGHLRVTLALRAGEDTPVPFKLVDLSPEEEALALATLDPIAAMAASDKQKVDELLREVQTGEAGIQAMLAELAEANGLDYGKQEPPDEPATIAPDRFEEVAKKWGTADGQIWQLGDHRILCGDSLQHTDILRLMGDEYPALVIADPPYGVNIVATNGYVGGGEAYAIPFGGRKKTALTGSDGASKPFGSKKERGSVGAAHVVEAGKYPVVIGDENTETAERAVSLYRGLYSSAVQVWWGANYYSPVLPASMGWLVWDKETTGNFADCELAWTNQEKAAKLFRHRWNGMLRDSERERRWHPTQKPAALAAWVYDEFTKPGDVVLDPFGGAGWSVLAGEQTGRNVRAIEMSHEYVAVICERWATMTGREPVLLTS
jgi:hypothetical protein